MEKFKKIDCSKISNKSDLMTLVFMIVVFTACAIAILLPFYSDSFWSGFISATIVWKWHSWLYKPLDRAIDKLWPDEAI